MPIDSIHRKSGGVDFRATGRQVPDALVGRWSGGFEITSTGLYLLFSSVPFSLSPDGSTLTLHAPREEMVFTHVWGTGSEIVGVWQRSYHDPDAPETPLEEEIHFRADGTQAWHWKGEFETLYGTYRVSEGNLGPSELRCMVEFEGNLMILRGCVRRTV